MTVFKLDLELRGRKIMKKKWQHYYFIFTERLVDLLVKISSLLQSLLHYMPMVKNNFTFYSKVCMPVLKKY